MRFFTCVHCSRYPLWGQRVSFHNTAGLLESVHVSGRQCSSVENRVHSQCMWSQAAGCGRDVHCSTALPLLTVRKIPHRNTANRHAPVHQLLNGFSGPHNMVYVFARSYFSTHRDLGGHYIRKQSTRKSRASTLPLLWRCRNHSWQ